MTRETKLTGMQLWFFPLTLAIHIAEEFWGGEGFLAWNARATKMTFSAAKFFVLVGIGFILVMVGVLLIQRYNRMRWIVSALAAIYLINGISHSISSLLHHHYSPGLFSGVLIWVPCSFWILVKERREASKRVFIGGTLAGTAIHAVITLLSTGIL